MSETVNYKDVKNIVSRHFSTRPRSGQPDVIVLYLDVITKLADTESTVRGYWIATDFAMKFTNPFEVQADKDELCLHIREAAELRDALDSALAHTIYAKPIGDLAHENPEEGR